MRPEGTEMDCFTNGVKDIFLKCNNLMDTEVKDTLESSRYYSFVPDDILEMCLVRLPLTSLMNARLVCKRWRHLTSSPQFMQLRKDGFHQTPLLSVSWCEGGDLIGRRNKAVTKLWELDMMYQTWIEVSVHLDAPLDYSGICSVHIR